MSKKKLKNIIMSMVFIGIIWLASSSVNAASISIQSSTSSANPGQSVTLTISSDCTGKVNLSASNGTLSTSSVWVEGNTSATVTVGSSGTTTITATPQTMSDANGIDVQVQATSISINIVSNSSGQTDNTGTSNNPTTTTTPQKSSNANLNNLGIKGQYDFTGFRAAKTSYSVTVPNEVESVEIYAYKGQNGQKITGAGVKQLNEGANTINVVVTAEDGKTTKTYTINVERKAAETEQPAEEPTEVTEEILGLSELKIEGIELNPEFKTDVYVYTAELTKDINTLNLTTIATNENTEIEITGNENLVEGENVITIMVKDKNSDKTATYQITVNKVLENNIIENTEINNEQDNKKKIIIIGVAIAVIIIIAILVIIIKKKRSYNMYVGDEYEDDEDDEEDYNLNTVDENEYQQEEYIDESNEQEYEDEEDYEEVSKKKKHAKGKRFK